MICSSSDPYNPKINVKFIKVFYVVKNSNYSWTGSKITKARLGHKVHSLDHYKSFSQNTSAFEKRKTQK